MTEENTEPVENNENSGEIDPSLTESSVAKKYNMTPEELQEGQFYGNETDQATGETSPGENIDDIDATIKEMALKENIPIESQPEETKAPEESDEKEPEKKEEPPKTKKKEHPLLQKLLSMLHDFSKNDTFQYSVLFLGISLFLCILFVFLFTMMT